MANEEFEFPTCMHKMAAAFHVLQIDPSKVTILLPPRDWWTLYTGIIRKYNGLTNQFDGRGERPSTFQYFGFTFEEKP